MEAVGLGINPPPSGFDMLNTILGIQQKKIALQQQAQSLQTGAYTQQSAQAVAQQNQMVIGQQQQLQQVLKTGIRPDTGESIYDSNNQVDPDKLIDYSTKNLSIIGQQVAQNVLKTKSDRVALSSASADLQDKYRNDLSGIARSFVNNPQAKADDLSNAFQSYAKVNPDASPAIVAATPLVKSLDAAGSMKEKNAALIHLSQLFQPAATTEASQRPAINTYQGAAGIQPFQSNQLAAGGVGNVGSPLGPQGVAPQMTTPPGGVPTPYVPGGAVGSPSKGPLAPGPTPTDQDLARNSAYETGLNTRVSIASDLLPRLQLINQAADNIRTGGATGVRADLAKNLQGLNAPQSLVDAVAGGNLSKVQEAEKLMFQTTFSGLRQSMQGDPARVAEFEAASKVFPSIDTDPRARHEILGFMADQGQRDYSEQQALNSSKFEGTFNPATWQAQYQHRLRAGQVPGVPTSQVPATNSKTPVRTGTEKGTGKKVIQYSDGSTAYAQ